MHKDLKIYVDRLIEEESEDISQLLEPDFLDIQEKDLRFEGKVSISGQAYLTKDHLILALKIKTTAKLPCSICNEYTEIPLQIDDFTHTVDLDEMKSAVYDFSEEIRTAIILKIPQFLECNHGHCPQRNIVNKFLKKPTDDTHSPFSQLTL